MRLTIITLAVGLWAPTVPWLCLSSAFGADATESQAVGPQYDSTHVYVGSGDVDRFVTSFLATFGGHSTKQVVVTVTPTPSRTSSQLLLTPVGSVSVFGYRTPMPYPFGQERTGYLVRKLDDAIRQARGNGAGVIVASFRDPIGLDAVIQWPGGVDMQLYWHFTAPSYPKLRTIPENRVYIPAETVAEFVKSFTGFSQGKIVSDDLEAPGLEIGRSGDHYRRIRIESPFGKMTVLVTDGHLPFPYGHETTGYEVADLAGTIDRAKAAGAIVVAGPYTASGRQAVMLEFPGGFVAEVHAAFP